MMTSSVVVRPAPVQESVGVCQCRGVVGVADIAAVQQDSSGMYIHVVHGPFVLRIYE